MTISGFALKEEHIDADVLVVGAGAGGMMAAITAADNGASVMLCEIRLPTGAKPSGRFSRLCNVMHTLHTEQSTRF